MFHAGTAVNLSALTPQLSALTPQGHPRTGGPDMEQDQDRERRIGVALLLGLAAFVLVALASFYFEQPRQQLSSIRENITSSTR